MPDGGLDGGNDKLVKVCEVAAGTITGTVWKKGPRVAPQALFASRGSLKRKVGMVSERLSNKNMTPT